MRVSNRAAVTILPTQEFIDWVNKGAQVIHSSCIDDLQENEDIIKEEV